MEFIKHPSCNHHFGPPPGVADKDCGTLHVKRWVDPGLGMVLTSFWRPNAADLAALNAGGSIAVNLYSASQPMMSTQVYKKESEDVA